MIAGKSHRGVQLQTVWRMGLWLLSRDEELPKERIGDLHVNCSLIGVSATFCVRDTRFSPICVALPSSASKDL